MGSREASILSQRCRDVLIGTILGDGCLERNGRNVRLRIDHGYRQKALVEWKFRQLAELRPLAPRLSQRVEPRTGKLQSNYRFVTRTTDVLNHYFVLFYEGAEGKRIPQGIAELLKSPLSVAVWYMDDGGRRQDCRGGYLNTNAYSVDDVELLRDCLRSNMGIVTGLHFAAGRPRIYVPSRSFGPFCDLIGPWVIDEMRYKLL